MTWEIFILLHALASALAMLQFRAIARVKAVRHAGLLVNALAFSALYICGLLVIPILGSVVLDDFLASWNMFVASASLFAIAQYLLYKALTHLDSATTSVLGTSSALFVVLLARVFYNEHLSTQQIIGISLLLPCIWYVLMLARKNKRIMNFKDINWVTGFYFAMGSSLSLALAHVLERDILMHSNLATYVAYGWGLQVSFAWLLVLVFGRKVRRYLNDYKLVRSSLQLGALRAATGVFFLQALVLSGNVSLSTVIGNFRIIIVAVLAGWLLGEKKYYYKKMAAAAASVVALSIIFWS